MINLNRWQINVISTIGLSFLLLMLVFIMTMAQSTTVNLLQRSVSPVISPLPNSNTAPVTTSIRFVWNDFPDITSVTSQTFVIRGPQMGQVGYNRVLKDNVLTLTPDKSFYPGETVQISLIKEIIGVEGNILMHKQGWQFTTAVLSGTGIFTLAERSLVQLNNDNSSWAVDLGDVDGDGDLDAVLANRGGEANQLWLNQGGQQAGALGYFSDSGQSLGMGHSAAVVLGDLDNDGDLDIVIGNNYGQVNEVWLNQGGLQQGEMGLFILTEQSFSADHTQGIALGDLDDDGYLDLFVANGNTEANQIWINNGEGLFSDSGQRLGNHTTTAVVLSDIDNDRDLDAIVSNWEAPGSQVWVNQGKRQLGTGGEFLLSSQRLGEGKHYALAVGDVDNDRDIDLIIASTAQQANTLWINQGVKQGGKLGEFARSTELLGYGSSAAVSLGDVDADQDMDLIVGNYNQPNQIWLNQGGQQGGELGRFKQTGQRLGASATQGMSVADINGDGDLDILFANGLGQANHLWLNNAYPDLRLSQKTNTSINFPGDLISYTLSYSNSGEFSAEQVIISNMLPPELEFIAYQSSRPITPLNQSLYQSQNKLYQWQVGDLYPAQRGLITLAVRVSPTLNSRYMLITNTATISTPTPNEKLEGNQAQAVIEVLNNQLILMPPANSQTVLANTAITLTAAYSSFSTLPLPISNALTIHSSFHAQLSSTQQITYTANELQIVYQPSTSFYPGERVQATFHPPTIFSETLSPAMWQFQVAVDGGSGYFSDSGQRFGEGDYTHAVALGDLDNDGDLDVFTSSGGDYWHFKRNRIWLNQGGIQQGTLGVFVRSEHRIGLDVFNNRVALGDLDGDGDLDVVLKGDEVIVFDDIWMNLGGIQGGIMGHFIKIQQDGRAVVVSDFDLGDLDNDGDLDIVVTTKQDDHNEIWWNKGGIQGGKPGRFDKHGQQFGGEGYAIALGDLDGDNDLDVFVVYRGVSEVWFNDGGFQGGSLGFLKDSGQQLIGERNWFVKLGDLDGDGDLDAVVGGGYVDVVWFNAGGQQNGQAGQFYHNQDLVISTTHNFDLGDIDNDGDLDLVTSNSVVTKSQVWLNEGGWQHGTPGYFQLSDRNFGEGIGQSVNLGDLDNDGDLDAFILNKDGASHEVWLNEDKPVLMLSHYSHLLTPMPGEAITYTVHYTNVGTQIATNTHITVLISPTLNNFSFQSTHPVTHITTTDGYMWYTAPLSVAHSATLTFSGRLPLTIPLDTWLTTTAIISSPLSFTPISHTQVVVVGGKLGLSISKAVTPLSNLNFNLGSYAQYTIILQNQGPALVSNISLTDTLSPALAVTDWISSSGQALHNGLITWQGSLSGWEKMKIAYTTRVTTTQSFLEQTITNTVDYSAPNISSGQASVSFKIERVRLFCPFVFR